MLQKMLIAGLMALIVFTGCKKDNPAYDFNLSATTWKGTYNPTGSSSFYKYTFIFVAGGVLDGNLNLNGSPQKITGSWIQDRNKVSTDFTIASVGGTWRGEGTINNEKTGMVFKGFSSQGPVLDFSVDLTLQ